MDQFRKKIHDGFSTLVFPEGTTWGYGGLKKIRSAVHQLVSNVLDQYDIRVYILPINVKVDGPAAPFFEEGKKFYYTRRGQMDIACAQCHEQNAGMNIGVENLSQGQSNGFPTYRLKWQKPGSLHRRFKGCNEQVRAKGQGRGADDYVNLELYLAWRGQGLEVETPAVRR